MKRWLRSRTPDLDEIRAAIGSLPDATQREAASENIFLVELVVANEGKFALIELLGHSAWKRSTSS